MENFQYPKPEEKFDPLLVGWRRSICIFPVTTFETSSSWKNNNFSHGFMA
jgi:hypothetical protein